MREKSEGSEERGAERSELRSFATTKGREAQTGVLYFKENLKVANLGV
jgi:hypothetical protein